MNKLSQSLSFHFKIANKNSVTENVSLFESGKNLFEPNFGNNAMVDVQLLNSYGDYKILLADLGPNPCLIRGMYIKSSKKTVKVTIIHSENLRKTEKSFAVFTGFQNLEDFIIGEGGFKVELAPQEEIEIHFRVYRRVNRTNPLYGKDFIDEYELENF